MDNDSIVKCPCGEDEYYGEMIWKDGIQWCRKCTYKRWQKETNYKWNPGKNDKVFPEHNN